MTPRLPHHPVHPISGGAHASCVSFPASCREPHRVPIPREISTRNSITRRVEGRQQSILLAILALACFSQPLPAIDELTWKNGSTLHGTLVSADASTLHWHPKAFLEAASLYLHSIRKLSFDAHPTLTQQPWAIHLRDGSRLHADLTAIDADTLTIHSPVHGTATLRRSEVSHLQRMNGGELVHVGPCGKTGWTEDTEVRNRDEPKKAVWQNGTGGTLTTGHWNSRATLGVLPPEVCDLKIRLNSSHQPEFALLIGDKNHGQLSLETWDNDIVLVYQNRFTYLRQLAPDDRRLFLHLIWDRTQKRYAAFAEDGSPLCPWQSYDPSANQPINAEDNHDGLIDPFGGNPNPRNQVQQPVFHGLTLVNKGADLTLEHLRIRRGNGQPPSRFNPQLPHLVRNDGQALQHPVLALRDGQLTLDSTPSQSLPISEVESIDFQLSELHTVPAFNTEVRLADGAYLRGRLQKADEQNLHLQTSFASQPLSIRRKPLTDLHFLIDPPDNTPVIPAPEEADLLTYGPNKNETLPGRFSPSNTSSLEWLPIGGVRPVKLLPSSHLEITRALPPDGKFPRTPAWLYLDSGDIIPAKLTSLDRETIHFEAPLLGIRELPTHQLLAVQFAAPQVNLTGFSDPRWQVVKGDAAGAVVKDDTLLLKPGTIFGHPTFMQGSEFRLTIKPTETITTLRMRLYCSGLNLDEPHLRVVIAQYHGNQIYVGLEEPEGQMREQIGTSITKDKDTHYRFLIHSTEIEVFVNDLSIGRIPFNRSQHRNPLNQRRGNFNANAGGAGNDQDDSTMSPRYGLGVMLESANLWGNGATDLTLHHFSIRPDPGRLNPPVVDPITRAQALLIPRLQQSDPPRQVLIANNGDLLRGTLQTATASHLGFRVGMEPHTIPLDRVSAAIWLQNPINPKDTIRFSTISIPRSINTPPNDPIDPFAPTYHPQKAHAEEIRKAALRGEDFGKLARSHSKDEHATNNGDWGEQTRENLPPLIASTVFKLQPGAISQIIDVDDRHVIIKSHPSNPKPKIHNHPESESLPPTTTPYSPLTHHLRLLDGSQFALTVDQFTPEAIIGRSRLLGSCRIPLSHLFKIRPFNPDQDHNHPNVSSRNSYFDDWNIEYASEPEIPEAGSPNSPLIGKTAKNFTLPFLTGGEFKLEEHRGKVIVLDFWASWCAPCIKSLPDMITLMSALPPEKALFVGVNQGEPAEHITTFLNRRQWQFPVALDSEQHIGQTFDVKGIPHTVIIDGEGKIAWVQTGYSPKTAEAAAEVIAKLLSK